MKEKRKEKKEQPMQVAAVNGGQGGKCDCVGTHHGPQVAAIRGTHTLPAAVQAGHEPIWNGALGAAHCGVPEGSRSFWHAYKNALIDWGSKLRVSIYEERYYKPSGDSEGIAKNIRA